MNYSIFALILQGTLLGNILTHADISNEQWWLYICANALLVVTYGALKRLEAD